MDKFEAFEASNFDSHLEELNFLRSLGFATLDEVYVVNSVDEVWAKVQALQADRDNLEYHIDGAVVKLNDNRLAKELGVVGKAPRAWCAVKFAAEEVTTKCLGITWQVGRTGKVTPVAELEPVVLAGTVVKRATLHNYKEFDRLKLRVGDVVIVRKAGDIIPEIVDVLVNLRMGGSSLESNEKALAVPQVCPSCGTQLVFTDTQVDLFCPNQDNCPAQVIGRLSYFCQRQIANIVGLSEKTLEKFVVNLGIKDIPDLYQLPYDEILAMPGFGRKLVNNLEESVNQSRNLMDYKFLAGLGIEGIGPEVAKLISDLLANKITNVNLGDQETSFGQLET